MGQTRVTTRSVRLPTGSTTTIRSSVGRIPTSIGTSNEPSAATAAETPLTVSADPGSVSPESVGLKSIRSGSPPIPRSGGWR